MWYGGFWGNYGKVWVIRYINNQKMLKKYMYTMRYGPFSKSHIWAELIYILKTWSFPVESLIARLNMRTTDGMGN